MKIYLVLTLSCMFLLTACNNADRYYYPSGKLKAIYHKKHGLLNGLAVSYYENGNKRIVCYYKNGYIDGVRTKFYPNEKIKVTEYYVKGLKNGWFKIYDSTTNKIIEEAFYKKNDLYTHVKYSLDGHCKYYFLRPYIEADGDTLHLSIRDSIKISFFQKDSLFTFEKYVANYKLFFKGEDHGYFLTIQPKDSYVTFSYDQFDDSELLSKVYIHLYCQILNDKIKTCCDSIELGTAFSSKLIDLHK